MGIDILASAPLASTVLLAQTQEFGPERDQAMAGPLGLFVTVFLVVVTIFLIRGMNKHVRRLNERVEREAVEKQAAEKQAAAADGGQDDASRA